MKDGKSAVKGGDSSVKMPIRVCKTAIRVCKTVIRVCKTVVRMKRRPRERERWRFGCARRPRGCESGLRRRTAGRPGVIDGNMGAEAGSPMRKTSAIPWQVRRAGRPRMISVPVCAFGRCGSFGASNTCLSLEFASIRVIRGLLFHASLVPGDETLDAPGDNRGRVCPRTSGCGLNRVPGQLFRPRKQIFERSGSLRSYEYIEP